MSAATKKILLLPLGEGVLKRFSEERGGADLIPVRHHPKKTAPLRLCVQFFLAKAQGRALGS